MLVKLVHESAGLLIFQHSGYNPFRYTILRTEGPLLHKPSNSRMMREVSLLELSLLSCEWAKQNPHMSRSSDLQYVTACFVLAKMLGVPWVTAQVRDKTLLNQYLRPNPSTRADKHKHSDRTILLGERLFNLQHLKGVQAVIHLLKTENIESTFALLAAGEMLYDSRIDIEYVHPTGKTGEDYDIHINASNDKGICCEVKTKVEETQYSEAALSNSLIAARKQLPKGRPGLVMVMVPELWLIDDTVRDSWRYVLESVFRNSNRIAGTVLFGEEWRFGNEGSAERMLKHIHWENKRSPFSNLILNEVLQKLHPSNRSSRWLPLAHLMPQSRGQIPLA